MLLEFVLCLVVIMVMRRLSDYLVFVRFNTIIRALQHIGSPEARSELMKVFRKFSESARLELSYLTVINRVVASNICTQDELLEGLNSKEEKLYCLTSLASVGKVTAMPVVCDVVRSERNTYALEAAIECVISIANKFPECKNDDQYKDALRYAALNRQLPIQSRLKAYQYFIEASGSASDIPYPALNWLEKLRNMLLSPDWGAYYVMGVAMALVLTQTDLLAILAGLLSFHEFGNFSGRNLIMICVFIGLLMGIRYFLGQVDRNLQQRVKSKADRKWLSLGESTSGVSRVASTGEIIYRGSEIESAPTRSIWRGPCVEGSLHKVVSFGLKHGYAVDYLQGDRITLRLMLRNYKTRKQVSVFYNTFSLMYSLFVGLFLFWVVNESNISFFKVKIALVCFQFTNVVAWIFINPHLSLIVSQVGQHAEVEGEVRLGAHRFPVTKADEAKRLMAAVIADIAGTPTSVQHSPVIQWSGRTLRGGANDLEDLTWSVSKVLENLKLSGGSTDERDHVRAVADYLKDNSDWEIELWPSRSEGTPDILIAGQLALDFMYNPNQIECKECIYRCVRFSMPWATWIILIDTPKAIVESLEDQLAKKGLEHIWVWNFPLN